MNHIFNGTGILNNLVKCARCRDVFDHSEGDLIVKPRGKSDTFILISHNGENIIAMIK
jgi:hypothetical protein